MIENLIKIKTTKPDLVFKAGSALETFRRVPDVIAVGGPSANLEKPNHYDIGINFRKLVSEATPEVKADEENNIPYQPAREATYEPIPNHTNHFTVEWLTPPSDAKEQARKEAITYLMANQEKGYEFTCEIVK